MSRIPAGGATNEYLSGLDLQEIYGDKGSSKGVRMTLDEAIKANNRIKPYIGVHIGITHAVAIQLGIEALERLQHLRALGLSEISSSRVWKPLPSEEKVE